jgi:hypothetical protein
VVAAGKISGDEERYPELLKKKPFGPSCFSLPT